MKRLTERKIDRKVLFSLAVIIVLFITVVVGFSDSGNGKDSSVSNTGFYFDTVVTITLNGTEEEQLLEECFSLMEHYEEMLSRTREESDVWKINHSEGEAVEVSAETAELIEKALTYGEISGGAFDITVAPVVDLWNFGEAKEHSLPDSELLTEALSHVDYRKVRLEGTRVTLEDPEAAIDLGGIAKGYIADRLKEFLHSKGITSGMINLGGNVLTIGKKMDGSLWKIGIRKPFAQTAAELSAVVEMEDSSLVTSGTYERYFEKDGVLYHHILDTGSGYPADTGLQSVSILSASSAEGDALSTTCFLLGLDRGMELIETMEGVEAMFISQDGAISRSSGFPGDYLG